MWEIIDNNGTIHAGSEDEMRLAFDVMLDYDAYSDQETEKWSTEWEGDLKLIQIHHISR